MSAASQVRSVMRNINLFVEEIPLVIFRLEEIIATLDISLSQSEFQFTFYNVASKISQAISRLRDLKSEPNVRGLLEQICDLVQREELNNCFFALDLLDLNSGSIPAAAASSTAPPSTPAASFLPPEEATPFDYVPDHLGNVELSRFGPMCHEPMASQSALARSVLQLLEAQDNVDLDFILPCDSGSGQAQVLKAHRVILAARCHWFHRALLSGMREAIDRKITLPDCSAPLMSMFLRFLYGENLDQVNISNDQLIELLILADRFEVAQLSSGCQTVLTSRLDSSNVLCLLAIADQWSATQLQESCVNYIWKHGDSIDKEGMEDLPPHLRSQVQMHTSKSQTPKHRWMNSSMHCSELYRDMWGITSSDRSSSSSSSSNSNSSSSSKESVDLLQELTNEMRIAVAEAEQEVPSS